MSIANVLSSMNTCTNCFVLRNTFLLLLFLQPQLQSVKSRPFIKYLTKIPPSRKPMCSGQRKRKQAGTLH